MSKQKGCKHRSVVELGTSHLWCKKCGAVVAGELEEDSGPPSRWRRVTFNTRWNIPQMRRA